jgi:urea transport system permease protein
MANALKPVRVNNAVRSAIDAALGSLRLFAPDPAMRLQAAEAVFRARDPGALPALDRALAKEADAGVKRRMQQARSAALLFSSDASEADRLDAVADLRERGDVEARSTLASLSGQPPAVAEAAQTAITAIDRVLQLWSILQSVYYGLSLGSVLLLAAAGLAITSAARGLPDRPSASTPRRTWSKLPEASAAKASSAG